jgi:hypothetical protein
MLPALTGLGQQGFGEPAALAPAFRTAMAVCAALLALGGVVAALGLRRTPAPSTLEKGPAAARRHCAVDAPPLGVTARADSR